MCNFPAFLHIVHELRNECSCMRVCDVVCGNSITVRSIHALHLFEIALTEFWLVLPVVEPKLNFMSTWSPVHRTLLYAGESNSSMLHWLNVFILWGFGASQGLISLRFFFFFGKLNVTNKNKCILCFPGWKGQSW